MMRSSWGRWIVAVAACSMVGAICRLSTAQTAYPMLMSLRPAAIQQGTTSEITVGSRYSQFGAYQVLVGGDGVTGEVVPPEVKEAKPDEKAVQPGETAAKPAPNPTVEKLKVRFTAAPHALPGVRDVRLATPQGVSTVGQLVVVRDPVVTEAGDSKEVALDQAISLPAAVCGAIEKNEDVDRYRFHVEALQTLVFLVRCARLQDRIHDLQTHADPILTLRTADGATLATSDNTAYHADPALSHSFTASGDYVLEIRDVRYQGNQYWEYCVEISDRPLVECVFPLAIRAEEAQSLELLGPAAAGDDAAPLTAELAALPADPTLGIAWRELPLAGVLTNPAPLVVTDVPLVREPSGANDAPATAQAVSVPGGANGRIEREGDVDYYAVEAKQGEALSVEVIARRARSELDAHLRIVDAAGKQLALNDDLRLGKRTLTDSWIENWIAPADGTYFLEVRDVHLRGGPRFPYFVQVTRSQPYFELYLDSDKTQITPGGCGALFVRIERKNGFTGAVQLEIDGLPPSVAAHCGRILADKGQDGCIVLQTAPDAALAVSNVVVRGVAIPPADSAADAASLAAIGSPYQETYQPGGGRGHWPVATHTVAVTAPADLRGIALSDYDVTLRPGESKRIEITIDRAEGFTANVTLDMLMRHLNSVYANTLPAGVTLNDKDAQSLLAGSATQGYLTLTAAKDAPPVENQQAVVLAHVALNFVMKWTYASPPLRISVAPAAP